MHMYIYIHIITSTHACSFTEQTVYIGLSTVINLSKCPEKMQTPRQGKSFQQTSH